MKIITSRTHPEIVRIHSLKQKKERIAQNLFIAEGERAVATLIKSPIVCKQLYTTEAMLSRTQALTTKDIITQVSDHIMEKISASSTPSGLLAVCEIPQTPDKNILSPGIVLAELNDPGNVGTLIRTAAALQVKTIVFINTVDPWSPKVVQASAGTIGSVNVFQLTWETLISAKKSLKLAALVVQAGKDPKEITTKNVLLIIGSEAHGIPKTWIQDCDFTVTLPMPGETESLNAAIAGALVMYQVFGP